MPRDPHDHDSGPPFWLIDSKTIKLTPEVAREHNELPPSPTERERTDRRVQFLKDRLLAGVFHPPHWVRAKVGSRTYRANGQHSSYMLMECEPDEFPVELSVHLDLFECRDMESLAWLFRQFDDRKSARSPADVSGAYQGLQSDLNDVPRGIAKLAVEGICWFRRNVREEKHTPRGDDQYVVFNEEEQHPFICWLGELFSIKTPELMAPPIIAAIYSTWQVDRDAAHDFWNEVARGGDPYEDDKPTTVLDKWLKDFKEGAFELPKKAQLYQGCIFGWNAARDGKTSLGGIRAAINRNLLRPI